jgi:hypothetical protein
MVVGQKVALGRVHAGNALGHHDQMIFNRRAATPWRDDRARAAQ